MASDCSGASKRLVEELGGTSAGEALRAPPTGFGATLERYLENGSPSEPKYLKKAPGLPRRSSLRSSFGQASVISSLFSFQSVRLSGKPAQALVRHQLRNHRHVPVSKSEIVHAVLHPHWSQPVPLQGIWVLHCSPTTFGMARRVR